LRGREGSVTHEKTLGKGVGGFVREPKKGGGTQNKKGGDNVSRAQAGRLGVPVQTKFQRKLFTTEKEGGVRRGKEKTRPSRRSEGEHPRRETTKPCWGVWRLTWLEKRKKRILPEN